MNLVQSQTVEKVVTLTFQRGKVNALNSAIVNQIKGLLRSFEHNPEIRSIILTGAGKFFSFGFDIPGLLSLSKARFTEYVTDFTDLYSYIFLYPKPIVAALNGHTIAGGCMLALACDYRVMVTGKAKISLNEISFGSSVFAGSTELLRFWVGSANTTRVLYSGAMYSAEEAQHIGLVDEVGTEDTFMDAAFNMASTLASKNPTAFASIKSLIRRSVAEEMICREGESIRDFVDIWYSELTRVNLQNIKIFSASK